jgi:hypothetical protein
MRRTAIIAGSVLTVVATGAVIAASGGAQAPAPKATVIKLISKGGTLKLVDVAPKIRKQGTLGAGDEFVLSAAVANAANKRVGTVDVHCSVTKTKPTARGVCDGIYALGNGELHIVARLVTDDDLTGSVVGGTGAYAGARGTFTSTTRPGKKSADASNDTITLLP